MYSSASINKTLATNFAAVSLNDLNSRAAMLERRDNKYVVDADVMGNLLARLRDSFTALEIDGLRTFHYETNYFDGPGRPSYFDHHRGKRRRAKFRIRKYTESRSAFVEIKLKNGQGFTVKKRLPCDFQLTEVLDSRSLAYVHGCYHSAYGTDFSYPLLPSLNVYYNRAALVSQTNAERITIDSSLRFDHQRQGFSVSKDIFILETKSRNGNGLVDKLLRELHQHPLKNFSKYCIGSILLERELKHNLFKPAIRKLSV